MKGLNEGIVTLVTPPWLDRVPSPANSPRTKFLPSYLCSLLNSSFLVNHYSVTHPAYARPGAHFLKSCPHRAALSATPPTRSCFRPCLGVPHPPISRRQDPSSTNQQTAGPHPPISRPQGPPALIRADCLHSIPFGPIRARETPLEPCRKGGGDRATLPPSLPSPNLLVFKWVPQGKRI